jgi:hypothetical protein
VPEVDRGKLAALDLVQQGLAGESERGGGLGEWQPSFGRVLADAGAQFGGDVYLPWRVGGGLLSDDESFAQPAVDGRGRDAPRRQVLARRYLSGRQAAAESLRRRLQNWTERGGRDRARRTRPSTGR